MTALEKAKLAAIELSPDEQLELFRWWVESDVFKQRQLAALKLEITRGVSDMEAGRYREYAANEPLQLAEEISSCCRTRSQNPSSQQ